VTDAPVPTIDVFDLGSKGLQHHGLRRANERAVLTFVGFNPGLSNAEIARMSGLAPQTVSAILNDVEAVGLITRGEVLRGRRGQPATPIFLKAEGAYSIGVEIGWRHADVVAIDLQGTLVAHRRISYDEADLADLPAQISDLVCEMLRGWPRDRRERLDDIGLGMPGSIHAAAWPLDSAPGSKLGPSPATFAAELEKRTGLVATLFNDGNAACWAEFIARPAPRPESFIYLLVSTFLAAGLIGEGRLWQGPTGHSGDLGAMLIDRDETGPLSAHAIASVTALYKRLSAAGFDLELTDIDDWDWVALEPVVADWIDDCGKALALVIFNTHTVVETNLVVLDTILPTELTMRLVAQVVAEFERLPSRGTIEIVAGTLGRLAPALGAAELPLYRRYFSRTLLEKSEEGR
jgi:predicted NBD/HSP70 family sugar kinase